MSTSFLNPRTAKISVFMVPPSGSIIHGTVFKDKIRLDESLEIIIRTHRQIGRRQSTILNKLFMLDYQSLPLEIWLLILEKAIASEKDVDFITPSYIPFRPVPDDSLDPAITVRAKVALVCREWQYLTRKFLYEDVRISRGLCAFRDSLYQHSNHGGMVRRLILPYRMTVTMPEPDSSRLSLEVLRLCTNLETLVRPRLTSPSEALPFHFEIDSLRLRSLRRLDWWYHSEAERSGGINSLSDVLQGTPNLEYLSVGGIAGYYPVLRSPYPLTLGRLRTLRLHHGSNGFLLRVIVSLWSLPALTNIIVDSPVAHTGLSHVWETLGAQLLTVEFGKHVRFMLDDHITACLQGCPNLVELNYYLFFTLAPSRSAVQHPSISRIGLHAAVNQLLNGGPKVCEHIEEHFAVFLDGTFPSLRRLVLHGEWRGIISHPRLAKLWQALDKRGIVAALPHCK